MYRYTYTSRLMSCLFFFSSLHASAGLYLRLALTRPRLTLQVRRRVLEERGRAELEEAADSDGPAAAHRSRTPSREKGKQEDGGADETEEVCRGDGTLQRAYREERRVVEGVRHRR